MSILIPGIEVIGPGAIGLADEGVLERVAERRLRNGWGLTEELNKSDVLVAPADCDLLDRRGWLLTVSGEMMRIRVIDCEADMHAGQMEDRGLLADANRPELAHEIAWMVFLK